MGTQVKGIRTREGRTLLVDSRARASAGEPAPAELTEVTVSRWLFMDKLCRNLAVVGGLLLVVVALRGSGTTEAAAVFSALQDSVSVQWDESLGKLTFVSNLVPESLRAVWSEGDACAVLAPSSGEITHVWSRSEPYIELTGVVADVRAAASGEVMSLAHGPDEELILRLRHDDGMESLYGNLQSCLVEEGAYVYAGDLIGQTREGVPLCFELRRDGRSVDPTLIEWSGE